MKFNFKKIVSVIATTVMLGSTIAFAAAAYPEPFVKSGAADAALVVGANAAAPDMAAATDLGAELGKGITATTSSSVVGGDSVKLERGTNKFNLGDALNTHHSSLDNEKFKTVLADATYLNDDNTEYKFEQKMELSGETLSYFLNSDFNDNKPVIGFNMHSSDRILNYTLDFTPTNAEGGALSGTDTLPKLDNTNLNMLGKTFYISEAEVTTNGMKLTLLDSANTANIAEGETKTVTVGEKSYEVTIDFISGGTTPEVKLNVNGQVTNSLNEGETYKLTDGTYVGIKDISAQDYAGGVKKVEFSLGMGKVVLENNQEVQLNEEDISTLEDANGISSVITSYITNTTATSIDKIVLKWVLDADAFVAPGTELVMPGFDAIKLSMSAWNIPKQETTVIDDDGDSVRVSTAIKDGDVKFSILYTNSIVTGFAGLGKSATHKLVTTSAVVPQFVLNETENSYFVSTWISGDEAESYVYELQSIADESGKNTTKLKSLANGGDITLDTIGDTEDSGQITYELIAASDVLKSATINISASSGTVYGNLLVSKEGLTMRLPVISNTTTGDGIINLTNASSVYLGNDYNNPASWVMNFTEEDKDGNILPTGALKSFTVTTAVNSGEGTEPTTSNIITSLFREEDGSDWYTGVKASDLATKVRLYNPSSSGSLGKAEIIYAGEESSADVYVTEAAASVGSANAIKVVKDSETASVSSNNLIVVGGACVNKAAAMIVGDAETALCGDAWASKTGAGAGKYLIQVAASPYNAGKIAMLIAGYDATDTTTAVAKVKEGAIDTTKNSATVYPLATA